MNDDQIITPDPAGVAARSQIRSLYGWALNYDPPDCPGELIGRLVTDKPTPYVLVADTSVELRARLPPGQQL